ncbi:MAG: tyrosine-protein phosphatase [Clostridia bacterium]|nr:tyrosine-protein phosphatase [Clostridia bacterium]
MYNKLLALPSLENTRDLGGMKTADGKTVKAHRLIRSGELSRASDADLAVLSKVYGVGTVVDLRTPAEILQAPDKPVPGARQVYLSLLDESFFGIARDEYSVEAWMNMFRDTDRAPEDVFEEMYLKLLFDDYAAPVFRSFFDVLLSQKEGAVLWHCSAGKDRVGVTSAVLELCLGVDEETVLEDYLLTGVFTGDVCRALLQTFAAFADPRQLSAMEVLLSVKPRYLRRLIDGMKNRYGGAKEFVIGRFGVTPDELQELRLMYLE